MRVEVDGMLKRCFAVAASCCLFVPHASAIVLGGTNLGFLGYPAMACHKPSKPIEPSFRPSRWEIDSYNMQVSSYNMQLQTYIQCVREYLENSKNDVKRIQEKMDEAIEDTKR
jgi:hypothetical protein